MHGATARTPRLIVSCTTGAAKSTSHVVKITSAPCPSSFAAQARAIAGLLPCVLHVAIRSFRPLTPPRAFSCLTRICAAASAGPSNGAIAPLPSYAQPITIGLLGAAGADAAVIATTAVSVAIAAASTPVVLLVITPPGAWVWTFSSPRFLSRLDEAVQRRVQRHRDAMSLRLADERAGDEVDLSRPVCFDVLQHRRIVSRPATGRQHVHLPRVLVELDPGSRRDRLPLVDEIVDEVAEVGRGLL